MTDKPTVESYSGEKLKFLGEGLDLIRTDIRDLKNTVALKSDTFSLKSDLDALRNTVALKSDMFSLKGDLNTMKGDMYKVLGLMVLVAGSTAAGVAAFIPRIAT